jgi:hypothetical protein
MINCSCLPSRLKPNIEKTPKQWDTERLVKEL